MLLVTGFVGWYALAGERQPDAGDGTADPATRIPAAPRQPPPPESLAGRTPEDIVALLLKRCHGTLQGAGKMANAVIQLGQRAADDDPTRILLGSQHCMRVQRPDYSRQTQIGKLAWHLTRIGDGYAIEPITGDALAALSRLHRLLRTALLEPLYQRAQVERRKPTEFAITTGNGETWQLAIRRIELPDGQSLWFPARLAGPPGAVTFETYQHIGVTNLPKQIVLDGIGRRWFTLEDCNVVYDPSVFTNPTLDTQPSHTFVKVEEFPATPDTGKCVLQTVAAKVALVTPDPGNWSDRFRVLLANGKQLHECGQQAADLDFLFDQDGQRYLAQPFMMGEPDDGGRPFVQRPGQRILHLPAHQVALVYPPRGSLEECEQAARKLLRTFLAEQQLRPAGPLRMIPWVEVDGQALTDKQASNLRIGFEQPVARR